MSVKLSGNFKKNIKDLFDKKKDWIYKETDQSMTFIKKYRELDIFEMTYKATNRLELCVPLNKTGITYFCVIKNNMEGAVNKYLENYENKKD